MSSTRVSFKLKVVIKRCPTVFIEGEEPGVIAIQDVGYDVPEDGSKDWQVAASLSNLKQELMEDVVEVTLEQLK